FFLLATEICCGRIIDLSVLVLLLYPFFGFGLQEAYCPRKEKNGACVAVGKVDWLYEH
ncbi:unnamed protein product, partial [Urochloa humidicola]